MVAIAERISFAADFARADLDAFGPADWESTRRQIDRFLSAQGSLDDQGGLLVSPQGHAAGPTTVGFEIRHFHMPEDELRSLQTDVKNMIGQFMHTPEHGDKSWPMIPLNVVLGIYPYRLFSHWPMLTREQPVPSALGGTRDVFLLRLFLLLKDASEAEKLLTCPECLGPFYRVHKMKFCTPKCTSRATQRAWRSSPKGKKQRREQANRRYHNRKKELANGKKR